MVIYRTQFFTAGTIKHGLEPGLLSICVTMVTEIPGDFIPENILFHPCWEQSAALGDESNNWILQEFISVYVGSYSTS